MTKTITLRLSDEEYELILTYAKREHRPISNFMMHATIVQIKESQFVDSIEMAQILSDEKLKNNLRIGHENAKNKKGKFVE